MSRTTAAWQNLFPGDKLRGNAKSCLGDPVQQMPILTFPLRVFMDWQLFTRLALLRFAKVVTCQQYNTPCLPVCLDALSPLTCSVVWISLSLCRTLCINVMSFWGAVTYAEKSSQFTWPSFVSMCPNVCLYLSSFTAPA